MNVVIGILLFLLAGYQVYRGRFASMDDANRSTVVNRAEKPVYFWALIVIEVALGIVLILGLIATGSG